MNESVLDDIVGRGADASRALQQLLDRRGLVRVEKPGCYQISATLIIRSHTRLVLAPGVTLRAAPLSRCALIENEHFAGGGRDEDISIEGGCWDGNCDEMGLDAWEETSEVSRLAGPYDPRVFKGKLIRFAHVDSITLEKLTVQNPVSYGIQIADAKWFIVRDLWFDYNGRFGTTDGVHINGPARFGLIENLAGFTNDDMVSLTSVDEAHAEVSRGPIDTVEIRNISAENGYSGVRLLSCGEPMTNVAVRGVYGTYRHNAVLISQHEVHPGEPVWFDNIAIERVIASKSPVPLREDQFRRWEPNAIENLPVVWIERGVRAGSVILRDIARHETAQTEAPLIQLDAGADIDRLVVENVHQTCREGIDPPLYVNEANVRKLICRLD